MWKVVHIDRTDTAALSTCHVDAFLIDRYSTQSPGGTGRKCDWDKARRFVETCGKDVLLAGGLTPENVSEAVHKVGPWGVDVSSGVEVSPGVKDIQRVKNFIERCREI